MTVQVHGDRVYRLVKSFDEGDGRHRTDFELTCGKCQMSEKIHGQPSMAPEGVFQAFRRKGWHVAERNAAHCICPTCITAGGRSKPPRKGVPLMSKIAASATESQQAKTLGMEARDATPAEARRIFAELDIYFDEANGRYRDNASDKTIGTTLNIPWATVAKLRDASGLKIKGDPEMLALRKDYDDLQAMFADWGKRLLAYENRASKQ